MKKILLTLTFLGACCLFAKAQFNAGAGLTYTNYGGEIKKATPGVHVRGTYYIREKYGIGLGLSYSLPAKSTYSEEGTSFESTTTFMAASLLATFHLIGTYESDFSLYFPVGASYQMGTSKFKMTSTQPGTTLEVEDQKLNGLTVNVNIGLQYRIGSPYVFAEAGFSLAANNTYNSREGVIGNNPAPGSTVLQLGIRFPFGSGVGGGVY